MVVRQLHIDAGAGRIAIVGRVGRGNVTVGAGIGARNEPIQKLQRRRTQSRHRDPIVWKRQPGERITDRRTAEITSALQRPRGRPHRTCCRVDCGSLRRTPNPNTRLLTIVGPPALPPYWFCCNFGFAALAGAKIFRACSASSRLNSQAAPVQLVVPPFVTTFTTDPELRPNSALYRVRLDLELLDRVRRRPHDEAGVERIVVARAVEQKVVGLRSHAVDAEARRDCTEPSRRGIAGAAAERWWRRDHPGHERTELGEVAPVQRQFDELLVVDGDPEGRVGSFNQWRLGPDGHALREAADGELRDRPVSCRQPTRGLSPARPA